MAEYLTPWFSMWRRPRATIREILDTDPTRGVLLVAVIWSAVFSIMLLMGVSS